MKASESATLLANIGTPSKGKLGRNLASNLLSLAMTILSGIWFTPYLIAHLGIAQYGLIPLAATLGLYVSALTVALDSALGRHLTMSLETGNHERATALFSTSALAKFILVLALIGPTLWLCGNATKFFRIPLGHNQNFTLLLQLSCLAVLLQVLSTSFSVSSYCRNRFDISSGVNVAATASRIGCVILLFKILTPTAWHMGAGNLLAASLTLGCSVVVWRYLLPDLRINLLDFQWRALMQVGRTAGWVVVNMVGAMLLLNIDLFVVNLVFGATATGQYAALLQWPLLLRVGSGAIVGVLGPTIVTLFAHEQLSGVIRYSAQSVRFLSSASALPIGLVCGFSDPLLSLWLGSKFADLAPVLIIMTLHLCVNNAVLPLFNVLLATDKIAMPGIVTLLTGAANLALAWILAGPLGLGLYGVAFASAATLTLKNTIFTPIYCAVVLGTRWSTFLSELLAPAFATIMVAVSCRIVLSLGSVTTWRQLFGFSTLISSVALVAMYHFLLTDNDRKLILGVVKKHRPI